MLAEQNVYNEKRVYSRRPMQRSRLESRLESQREKLQMIENLTNLSLHFLITTCFLFCIENSANYKQPPPFYSAWLNRVFKLIAAFCKQCMIISKYNETANGEFKIDFQLFYKTSEFNSRWFYFIR